MTPSPLRCAVLALFALALTACQSHQPETEPAAAPTPAVAPVEPSAHESFDASLTAGRLEAAEAQLDALRRVSGDTAEVLHAQRRLAEAYLREGQRALESGDMDKAAKSLSHARNLMPQAPALTTGLDGAIGKAKEAERSATQQAQAARQEQLRLLRQAAEAQAAATREQSDDVQGQARLIDPSAPRSDLSLAMLDSRDEAALFERLDAAAADIVAFDRGAHLEVRSEADLKRVRALLMARVMQRSPLYVLRLSHAIKPAQVPHLVLEARQQ